MDKQEFSTFAMALRTYYPREQILPNKEAMALWYQELQDIPYQVATAALRKWVGTNKWSPSIAEIREVVAQVTNGEEMTWGEAWDTVLKAIRKYGSYGQVEAMKSLDPVTRRCLESLGYINLCISENISVERANFRMIFDTFQKREQERRQLALPLQETIKSLQLKGVDGNPLALGEGEQ